MYCGTLDDTDGTGRHQSDRRERHGGVKQLCECAARGPYGSLTRVPGDAILERSGRAGSEQPHSVISRAPNQLSPLPTCWEWV